MVNINNFFQKKEGFSLIEILVVIAVMGLIVISTANLFTSGLDLYVRNKDETEIRKELRFITNYVDENIKYAEDVEVDNAITGYNIIKLDNSNYFILNGRRISNIQIDVMNFTPHSTEVKILNFYIEKDGYSIRTNILLNNNKKFENKVTGNILYFK